MNNPIELNQISDVWLVARISPVPKKTTSWTYILSNCTNFTNTIKILWESCYRTPSLLEGKIICHQHQPGYCKNHSNTALLTKMRDDISKEMKHTEITLAVLEEY